MHINCMNLIAKYYNRVVTLTVTLVFTVLQLCIHKTRCINQSSSLFTTVLDYYHFNKAHMCMCNTE